MMSDNLKTRALLLAGAFFLMATTAFGAEAHWDIQYRYQQINSTLTLHALSFPSAVRGVACGVLTDRKENEHPIVLVTSDGGQHWTENPIKEPGLSLFFLDDSIGWMVTEKGIWQTQESGRSWTKIPKAPAGLLRVWFLDKQHGYAAGLEKRVFETNDGGASWAPLPILKEVQGDPTYTTFGEIAFAGKNGLISGWNIPPRPGGPDWMEPERAAKRRQIPTYGVLLETTDAGKTWTKSEASVFGQVTRISMTPQGSALGLSEFKDTFEFPSEVYRVNMHTGKSESSFRTKDRAITDIRAFAGSNKAVIAGYETAGTIYRSPIPGKLKVLTTDDLQNWQEMKVDYRAVAHSAMIAGPDENNLWIGTDTGMILKLVTQ
jgi:photosystem II stability/assembly factor-like uncharacterized protein